MTKTQRASSSYFRHIARQYDSHMPLLKPPRRLMPRWRTLLPDDRGAETTLPVQVSPAHTTGTISLLHASSSLSTQLVTELPHMHPTRETALPTRGEDVTPSPSTVIQPSRLHTPVAPPSRSPVTGETASTLSKQPPPVEVPLAPAKSVHMSSSPVTGETASTLSKQPPPVEVPLAPAKSVYMSSPPVTGETASTLSKQPPPVEVHLAPTKSVRTSSSPVTGETASTLSKQPSPLEVHLAPAKSEHTSSSPVIEKAATLSKQPSPVEIRLAPAKSTHSETSRASKAMQVTSKRQTEVSGNGKPVSVTLRPQPPQETTTLTPTNSRHTTAFLGRESKTHARVSEPQLRTPEVLPYKQEAQQQQATIYIGTIDIHIVPPAPPVPLPPVQRTAARSSSPSALAREMTSLIGLRQA